ncbi:MAG TPA: hypothetical protein VH912_17420 [Streptosporangiaceae bacterium]|jgi:hypothetical protein
MELRLGSQVFHPGDFVLWNDIAPGARPLVGDQMAGTAAATRAGLVCADPAVAARAGVRPDGIVVDAGTMPTAALVEACLSTGHAVLVTLDRPDGAATEPDPGVLAAVSVYAWLGVRVFRADPRDSDPVRQVLDMVASIKGTRPPARTVRGLA